MGCTVPPVESHKYFGAESPQHCLTKPSTLSNRKNLNTDFKIVVRSVHIANSKNTILKKRCTISVALSIASKRK